MTSRRSLSRRPIRRGALLFGAISALLALPARTSLADAPFVITGLPPSITIVEGGSAGFNFGVIDFIGPATIATVELEFGTATASDLVEALPILTCNNSSSIPVCLGGFGLEAVADSEDEPTETLTLNLVASPGLVFNNGLNATSILVTVDDEVVQPPPTNSPTAPTALTLAPWVGAEQVLTWTDASFETGYTIESRHHSNGSWGPWELPNILAANSTQFSFTTSVPGGYQLRVQAINDLGAANAVSPTFRHSRPTAPTSISITQLDPNSGFDLRADWVSTSATGLGFEAQVRTSTLGVVTPWETAVPSFPTSPQAFANVAAARVQFRVRAYNAVGSSGWTYSGVFALEKPARPVVVDAAHIGGGVVELNWTYASPLDARTTILIQPYSPGGGFSQFGSSEVGPAASTGSYTIGPLSPGWYRVQVSATNAAGSRYSRYFVFVVPQ